MSGLDRWCVRLSARVQVWKIAENILDHDCMWGGSFALVVAFCLICIIYFMNAFSASKQDEIWSAQGTGVICSSLQSLKFSPAFTSELWKYARMPHLRILRMNLFDGAFVKIKNLHRISQIALRKSKQYFFYWFLAKCDFNAFCDFL